MNSRAMSEKEVKSPSSRRAWVEMLQLTLQNEMTAVALLAEGVGRNKVHVSQVQAGACRPPRGGRG